MDKLLNFEDHSIFYIKKPENQHVFDIWRNAPAATHIDFAETETKPVIERVKEIAEKYNVQRAEVALAWLLKKEQVVSPIVGATKFSHLETAVSALNLELTQEDIKYLEEEYVPHNVVGAV